MPFITLNNNWSNLAQQYNKAFNNKPEVPAIKYTGFDDGLIRGGAINVGIASVRDTARIGRFFASTKGVLFITKQVGLQLSNPLPALPANNGPVSQSNLNKLNVKTSSGLVNKATNALNTAITFANNFSNNIGPTRVYNLGVNTLAQIPINAIGGHIIRHGLKPVGGVGFLGGDSSTIQGYNYEKITYDNNILQGSILRDYTVFNPNRLMQYFSIINNNNGVTNLLEYNGGASSVYGIGKTRINTTNIRTTIGKGYNFKNPNLNGFEPLTNGKIINTPQANLNSDLEHQLLESPLSANRSIASKNIEHRIGVSTKTKSSYKVDSINVINVTDNKTFYTNAASATKPTSDVLTDYKGKIDGYYGRDIIKFRFEFLNNDVPIADNKSINTDVLAFRAYIDDFQDGMTAKWNPYRYMGRGEEFYVYEGFTRDISVAFTLFAHSPEEMKPIYTKLNYLMSTFAPDYSAQNKMRGNIGYLTVGDYLYRQPGVFTDIKLGGMLDSHWEIALNDPEGDINDIGQYEVPKHIKVNMSFKPIHTFLPRKVQKDKYSNTPFITLDKKAYGLTTNKYLD